jgi:aspartate/methionine/tyrosine aminotransferase
MAGATPAICRTAVSRTSRSTSLPSPSRPGRERRSSTLCSPSNPDGRVISARQLRTAIEAARRHDFVVVFDECYAELYDATPPPGALDVLAAIDSSDEWLSNVMVLHSLSKRSSAAGLRSGFAAGDRRILAALNRVRLNGTACTPLPLLAAATALWSDDVHVEAMRTRLRERKDMADRLLGRFAGYYRPPCGFFLWLRVDDGVALTERLWGEFALKVLPGAYLTQPDGQGSNAGVEFVRIALVHDPETTRDGLTRLSEALGVAPASAGDEAATAPLAKRRKWA